MWKALTVAVALLTVAVWGLDIVLQTALTAGPDDADMAYRLGRITGAAVWPIAIAVACKYFSRDGWQALRRFNVIGLIVGVALLGGLSSEAQKANTPEARSARWKQVEPNVLAGFKNGFVAQCTERKAERAANGTGPDILSDCKKLSACVEASYAKDTAAQNELRHLWAVDLKNPKPDDIPALLKLVTTCAGLDEPAK